MTASKQQGMKYAGEMEKCLRYTNPERQMVLSIPLWLWSKIMQNIRY